MEFILGYLKTEVPNWAVWLFLIFGFGAGFELRGVLRTGKKTDREKGKKNRKIQTEEAGEAIAASAEK